MKKIYSLLKACMSSDMNIFKIKQKKDNKSNKFLPLFISLCLMFSIWTYANMLFEKMAPLHLQFIVLALAAFTTALMVIVEGVYKAGPLIFNCKDDQLLLSLPIKRRTVLFVRVFKFYIFEVLFNALFLIPVSVAYIRWAESLEWTFLLTSIIMVFFLPVIPVVISCIIGAITSSLSGRFKFKNLAQIVISMLFLLGVLYLSMNLDSALDYVTQHATSINDMITKIYYPAGVYASLSTNFNVLDLLIFIGVNIGLFAIFILIMSKFYFKINSRLKKVETHKKGKVGVLKFKQSSVTKSLVKKELNTFFKTPVFIINAGFGVVLFIIACFVLCFKLDSLIEKVEDVQTIKDNISVIIFGLIAMASFTTSITSSMISLEGKSINILKSLPIHPKKILLSKILASSILTIPAFLLGVIVLFIRFRVSIIEMILLLILTIITPLISHFIGLIINLHYPKLDSDSSAEVIKQSTSSAVSVILGIVLLSISSSLIIAGLIFTNSIIVLVLSFITFGSIDLLLYSYINNKGVKLFNNLSI